MGNRLRQLTAADPVEFGQYQAIAELGRGRMGRVLLSCAQGGELVAVKQVRGDFVVDDGFRARFRREVEAARTVSGPYTAAVLDADAEAAEPWMTSAFVHGPSLGEAARAVGGLPENSVLQLAGGLSAALADVHRAGLVHRGLKPSDVLLAQDGPRLVDFGLARASRGDLRELTAAGSSASSAGFMSPEQVQGLPSGPASDVFSLGTVLAVACTGVNPFAGPSAAQTLHNVVHADPDLSTLPQAVRRIVAMCLAKDLASRPSPAELTQALGGFAPAPRPWPLSVYELLLYQHTEIVRLRAELAQGARFAPPGRVIAAPPPPPWAGPAGTFAPAPAPPPPQPPRRRMNAAGIAVIIAVTVAVTAIATALAIEHGGTRVTEPPPVPTIALTQVPSPDTGLTASVGPAPSFSFEASALASPLPSSIDAHPSPSPSPSRQAAFLQRCAADQSGRSDAVRPKSYLLACGDGAAWLDDMEWSDWGTPTAYATGVEMQDNCKPDCADGTPIRYPAEVTLTDLVDGQYTLMRISAPGAGWTGDFRIDSDGLGPQL